MTPTIDATQFRQVLGQYPTGVVIVTAYNQQHDPIGMTVGSFTSVSLDPPLVTFMPAKDSQSWRELRSSGDKFCVNILGAHQESICRAIAMRRENKFQDIAWTDSPDGSPIIDGSLAYIDCETDAIHDAGDHEIVIGRVTSLELVTPALPLLFFRGGYGSFRMLSLIAADRALIGQLRTVDSVRPLMETLAHDFDTEVTAMALIDGEVVLLASAGRAKTAVAPTRVGQRVPFIPPIGGVFAAWGDEDVQAAWAKSVAGATTDDVDEYRKMAQAIKQRGYAIGLGHRHSAVLESLLTDLVDDPISAEPRIHHALVDVRRSYNPTELNLEAEVELRFLSVPVFDSGGHVALSLTMWGPPELSSPSTVSDMSTALAQTATAATLALGGSAMAFSTKA